jgi:hypothetical protein
VVAEWLEAIDSPPMTPPTASSSPADLITSLLGLYKAEWLNGQLFDLFTEPEYFKQLEGSRPCVLVGGRGTGKTTVLRGLSYLGQFARGGHNPDLIGRWSYYGLYYRVDTNRVAAFKGPELPEQQWARCFAHYFNLLLCGQLLDFVLWYRLQTSNKLTLSGAALRKVQLSLNLPACASLEDLERHLDDARLGFEASVNNVADGPPPGLSMQSAPVNELAEALCSLSPFQGKQFYFLIDEYENFENYQQQIVNSMIKHAPASYTFKIGVRELGWRERGTVNSNERLTHPADYVLVNIRDAFKGERFGNFAARVCNGRLARAEAGDQTAIGDIRSALSSLTEAEEAELLGVERVRTEVLGEIEAAGDPDLYGFAAKLPPTLMLLVKYWTQSGHGTLVSNVRDVRKNRSRWRDRVNNYLFCALFTIKRGRRGIRKYYAGWRVLTQLANGNIRFLLELVHTSYLAHFENEGELSEPITPEEQTIAAQQVGARKLTELEGISVEGGRLTKLVLSLGRVFQVLAESPEGHTPEVTEFHVEENGEPLSPEESDDLDQLLRLAVMHQALVRSTGNKLLDEMDTREYDYRVHPIFAPFFGFSYRQKRKLKVTGKQVLGLTVRPRDEIRQILNVHSRANEEELPDQLKLFDGYYHGGR